MSVRDAPERFPFIDGLRGFAAAWVVLFHASAGGHLPALEAALPPLVARGLFTHGHFGVAIFFVLSGFVIAHSLYQRRVDARFFGRFALRRSIRLDPPYIVSIAVVLTLGLLSARVKHEPFEFPTLRSLASHVTYTQGIQEIPPINSVYWTLPYEFQFYLVFCFLLGVSRAADRVFPGRAVLLIFAPLCVLALGWPTRAITSNLLPGLWLDLWYSFLLGVLAYWSWRNPVVNRAFAAFCTVVLVAAVWHEDGFALVSASTAAIIRLAAGAGKLGTWLRWPWIQGLGAISYSLYLIHNPIGGATFFLLRKLLGTGIVAEATGLGIVVAVTLLCAIAFWYLFERPFVTLARRIKLAPKVG